MGTSAAILETVEGTKGLSPGYLGAAAESFNSKYKEKYGKLPPSCWASYGYDATWLAALAINMANSTDTDKIKGALHKIALGTAVFPEEGIRFSTKTGCRLKKHILLRSTKTASYILTPTLKWE